MKKFFTQFFVLAALLMGATQVAQAQIVDKDPNSPTFGQVVWTGSDVAQNLGGYVYLYNVGTGQFVNAGASYGVQAVLSSVGMRLKITNSADGIGAQSGSRVYNVQSRIDNPAVGNYMSSTTANSGTIYLDRKSNYNANGDMNDRSWPNWVFVETTGTVTVNGVTYTTHTYRIYNYNYSTSSNRYLGTNANGTSITTVGQNGTNNQWRVITEADYQAAMNHVTWGEVDLGAFVQDAEFGRSNLDGRYWVWEKDGNGGPAQTATDHEGYEYTLDTQFTTTGEMTGDIHWHQRNQNDMVNGYIYANGGGDVLETNIPMSRIGRNVITGVGATYNAGSNYSSTNFRTNISQYYAAEIYREVNKLTQTLTLSTSAEGSVLKDGLYKLTAQALYYDDNDGLTNDNAYFIVETKDPGATESVKQRLLITPMNKETNSITAHSGVSAGYTFDTNADAYILQFFVELKDGTELTIGIETEKAEGWTVIGNVHLYAHGKEVLAVDEDWGPDSQVLYENLEQDEWSAPDPYAGTDFHEKYTYPSTVLYRRTMTTGQWNTICLPFNLTPQQVRQAFGNDCVVSEFQGVSVNQKTLLYFTSIDLDQREGMQAFHPYLIKPTQAPEIGKTETITEQVGNGENNHTITLSGPVYRILGVTKASFDGTMSDIDLEPVDGAGDPKIHYQGTIYRKDITVDDVSAKDYWLVTKGNMYHLNGSAPSKLWAWNSTAHELQQTNNPGYTVWGTYCYLWADKSSGAKVTNVLEIVLDGVMDDVDHVDELAISNSNHRGEGLQKGVYSLNGQKLSDNVDINCLPKGIYVINGSKYVVK